MRLTVDAIQHPESQTATQLFKAHCVHLRTVFMNGLMDEEKTDEGTLADSVLKWETHMLEMCIEDRRRGFAEIVGVRGD